MKFLTHLPLLVIQPNKFFQIILNELEWKRKNLLIIAGCFVFIDLLFTIGRSFSMLQLYTTVEKAIYIASTAIGIIISLLLYSYLMLMFIRKIGNHTHWGKLFLVIVVSMITDIIGKGTFILIQQQEFELYLYFIFQAWAFFIVVSGLHVCTKINKFRLLLFTLLAFSFQFMTNHLLFSLL